MKYLHLITGLLISFAVAGCGDYGDDGAVNSTGTDDDTGSTDFTLAVAIPTFGDGGGSKPRLRTESEAPVARAVTGSTAYTVLARSDVRAFVIVTDSGNANGYREVPIEVVEFENLGNGRYRIAIDGQAQVDGFFAITIDGVIYKVPLSRTGSTDEPIDVNALQSALADRLQALLVADQVCDSLTVDALDGIVEEARSYLDSLSLPDDINDVDALVSFYGAAAASFMQSEISFACAPTLSSVATAGVPGTWHALQSGVSAGVDDLSPQASTDVAGFTTQFVTSRTLDEIDSTQALQEAQIERDDRYLVTYAADSNGIGVLTDLSVQFPDITPQQSTALLTAFANDASRAALQFDSVIEVEPDVGSREFTPGFVVAATPAYQLLPHGSSLFGASQTTKSGVDLSEASATCLASIGMTSAQLADAQAFGSAAQNAIDAVGDEVFAARLRADCGGLTPIAVESRLQIETRASGSEAPLAIADLAGSFGFVGLEWTRQLSASADGSGYEAASSSLRFDIDVDGSMTQVAKSHAEVLQPVAASLGGFSSDDIDSDAYSLSLPLDEAQNALTDGHVLLTAVHAELGTQYFNGFVSAAPHDLMALNLAALTGSGDGIGGYTVADTLPDVRGSDIAVGGGSVGLIYGYESIDAIDISNPQNLALLGSLATLDGQDIAIDGTGRYAFVAAGSQGLQVIDLVDPAAMRVVGSGIGSPTISYASHIALITDTQGNAVLALVGDSASNGLVHAIDVLIPAAPVVRGSYSLGAASVSALGVTGNALLIGFSGGLAIVDFSQFLDADPRSNSFSDIPNSLSIDGVVTDIAVVGSTAYLTSSSGDLDIVDVADIAGASTLGSLALNDYAENVSVQADRAFVTLSNEGFSGLAVVDVSVAASPQLVAVLPPVSATYPADGYLVAPTLSSEYGTVALRSDTPGPQRVGSITSFGFSPSLQTVGSTVYMAGTAGFSTHDISNPTSPVQLDVLDATTLGAAPRYVDVFGSYAYITTQLPSLVIVDISDPANLSIVGTPFTLTGLSTALEVFAQGSNRYVAVGTGSTVELINVTTVTAPSFAQSLPINDQAFDFAFSADGLTGYVAASNGIFELDLQFIGNATFTLNSVLTDVRGIEVDGAYVYAASFSNGFHALNPADWSSAGRVEGIQYLYGIVINDGNAYLRGEYGISVVDIGTPTTMQEIGFVGLPSFSFVLAVSGSNVVVDSYDSTLQAYRQDIYQTPMLQRATSGIAVGVRLPSTPLTATALVGTRYSLTGQQLAQINNPSTSRQAAFGALAAGNLRFVAVDGAVYPVFDLPLAGMVVSDFSGVMPKLEIRFGIWQPGAVSVDGDGRWSFTLTNEGDTATFAGYVGVDGTLVGHGILFVPDPAQPPVADGGTTTYPGLVEASQLLMMGVPSDGVSSDLLAPEL